MTAILLAIMLFQLKHFVADFLLQNSFMISNKGVYGHPGGLLHALVHSLLTGLVLLLFSVPVAVLLSIMAAEFIVHYHIDWTKEFLNKKLALSPDKPRFWYLMGFDQLLHQLTYIAIAGWVFL